MEKDYWKKCSSCKKEIPFSSPFYLCSVSTCKRKRTGYQFCSVPCWDEHLGFANHRQAWAEEAISPSKEESESMENERNPVRQVVNEAQSTTDRPVNSDVIETETLVVVSKVKKFIKEQSDFNTSKCGVEALTRKVASECLKGIENAKQAGRKTVMGRDIE